MAGLKTIIALSFVRPSIQRFIAQLTTQVLAIGFLLVILSCALYHSYFPLLVPATYILAPLPNFICSRCAPADDFMGSDSSASSAFLDFGRFMTGFLVVMGIALPVLLAHCWIIVMPAAVMSIVGGALIYGTIVSFTMFFQEDEEF